MSSFKKKKRTVVATRKRTEKRQFDEFKKQFLGDAAEAKTAFLAEGASNTVKRRANMNAKRTASQITPDGFEGKKKWEKPKKQIVHAPLMHRVFAFENNGDQELELIKQLTIVRTHKEQNPRQRPRVIVFTHSNHRAKALAPRLGWAGKNIAYFKKIVKKKKSGRKINGGVEASLKGVVILNTSRTEWKEDTMAKFKQGKFHTLVTRYCEETVADLMPLRHTISAVFFMCPPENAEQYKIASALAAKDCMDGQAVTTTLLVDTVKGRKSAQVLVEVLDELEADPEHEAEIFMGTTVRGLGAMYAPVVEVEATVALPPATATAAAAADETAEAAVETKTE